MAGSSYYFIRHTYLGGKINTLKTLEVSFTADASTGAFPVFSMPSDLGGIVMDTSVVFDGTTPPNALTFTIRDGYGLTIDTATGITASTTRGRLSQNTPFANGGTITLSGNTTNSAKVKVILYVI